MHSLNQVAIIAKFKPDRNGGTHFINPIQIKDKQTIEITSPEGYNGKNKITYSCNRIVQPNVNQTQFYNELGENITENLFKNQSALFLAYGSSGSGKTYTTVGTARNEGILQRMCQDLLNLVFQKSTSHISFFIKFSVVALYDECGVDLLLKRPIHQGSNLNGSTFPCYEMIISSYQDFISTLLRTFENHQDFEKSSNRKRSDCHIIYTLSLYQKRYSQESLLSLVQFVDFACSKSIQLLLDTILSSLKGQLSSLPSSSLLFTFLQPHFFTFPSSVFLIHCISNDLSDFTSTFNTCQQIAYFSSSLSSSASASIPLCSTCMKYYQQIEESIRDQVILEIFARQKAFHSSDYCSNQRLTSSINQFLQSIQGVSSDMEVNEVIRAYDEENRDLLIELAEQKRKVQELTEMLDDSKAQIMQLNNIISILQKSQPCWVKNSSSNNQSSSSPINTPMFQPKHIQSSYHDIPAISPISSPISLPTPCQGTSTLNSISHTHRETSSTFTLPTTTNTLQQSPSIHTLRKDSSSIENNTVKGLSPVQSTNLPSSSVSRPFLPSPHTLVSSSSQRVVPVSTNLSSSRVVPSTQPSSSPRVIPSTQPSLPSRVIPSTQPSSPRVVPSTQPSSPSRVVPSAQPSSQSRIISSSQPSSPRVIPSTQPSYSPRSNPSSPIRKTLLSPLQHTSPSSSPKQPAPSSPLSKPQRASPPPPSSSPPKRASPPPPSSSPPKRASPPPPSSSPPKRPFPSPPSSPPPQAPSSPSSRPPITPSSKPALPTSTCFVIDGVRIEPSLSTEEIKLNSQETDDEFDAIADDISISDFDMTIMNTNKASDNHDVRLSSILRPSFIENAIKDMLT